MKYSATVSPSFHALNYDRILPGVGRLIETPLVINGAEGSTILRFNGADASAAGWREIGGAGTLALQAGTAPTYGVQSPYLKAGEAAVKGNAGGAFRAASDAIAQVSTCDFLVEVGFRSTASTAVIASKRTTAAGFQNHQGANRINVIINDGTNQAVATSGLLTTGAVYLFHCFCNKDIASTLGMQTFVDGATFGAGADPSAVGSIGSSELFTLLSHPDLSYGFDSDLLWWSLQYRASWFDGAGDSTEWATIAAQRFALLTGSAPAQSRGNTTNLISSGSTSATYQEKFESGATKLYYMGAGEPRFCQKIDANGKSFTGMLVEAGAENVALQSRTAGTTWTVVDAAIAASDSDTAPDGTVTADTLTASANGGYLRQTFGTISAVQRVYSHWVRRNGAGNVAGKIQIVKTSDASVIAEQAFTATALWQRIEKPGTCVVDDTEIRLVIDTSGESLYVWEGQFEAGDGATSNVTTTTAAVTRAADNNYYTLNTNDISTTEGSLYFSFWAPTFTPTRNHYLCSASASGVATNAISLFLDTNGRVNLVTASTGGSSQAGSVVEGSGSRCDNTVHDVLVTWKNNNLTLTVDNVLIGTDTSIDVPVGLNQLRIGNDAANTAGSQAGPALVGNLQIFPKCGFYNIIK